MTQTLTRAARLVLRAAWVSNRNFSTRWVEAGPLAFLAVFAGLLAAYIRDVRHTPGFWEEMTR